MTTRRIPVNVLLAMACLFAAFFAVVSGASAKESDDDDDDSVKKKPVVLRPITAPVPGSATPASILPPGAFYPDNGPSRVVYPAQKITIRFNHKKHIAKDIGMKCVDCHEQATKSTKAADRMMPPGTTCDGCHGSDHSDKEDVKGGDPGFGSCDMCHVGWKKGDDSVPRMELPTAHLKSNHKVHADRNINCEQCHGAVQETELATMEQLPRMKGCFGCHAMSGPSAGNAKSDCAICHETKVGTLLKTSYKEGPLLPPRWMGNLEHTADFLDRHKRVAADNSQACGSCHKEDFCTDCHDGRVRPRSVHPNDYISIHPTEARLDNPRCSSCHQEQSFCMPCHQRSGVTMSGSPGNQRAKGTGRFHPPRSVWSDPPRTQQHHAWEAQRNLNACVSCHTERDCAVCHASKGVGGQGFNPHPAGFISRCASAARKNVRPCLVCHEQADIAMCR